MRKRTSLIWKIKKEEFQALLDKSSSIVQILESLGFDGHNGNHRTVNQRIKEDNLDLTKFNHNKRGGRETPFILG